jgi:hypothetical protein
LCINDLLLFLFLWPCELTLLKILFHILNDLIGVDLILRVHLALTLDLICDKFLNFFKIHLILIKHFYLSIFIFLLNKLIDMMLYYLGHFSYLNQSKTHVLIPVVRDNVVVDRLKIRGLKN